MLSFLRQLTPSFHVIEPKEIFWKLIKTLDVDLGGNKSVNLEKRETDQQKQNMFVKTARPGLN